MKNLFASASKKAPYEPKESEPTHFQNFSNFHKKVFGKGRMVHRSKWVEPAKTRDEKPVMVTHYHTLVKEKETI